MKSRNDTKQTTYITHTQKKMNEINHAETEKPKEKESN